MTTAFTVLGSKEACCRDDAAAAIVAFNLLSL
jgi:hypothetical protein